MDNPKVRLLGYPRYVEAIAETEYSNWCDDRFVHGNATYEAFLRHHVPIVAVIEESGGPSMLDHGHPK